MNSYFVYILRCVDRSYYVGVTSDLDSRFTGHQQGMIRGGYIHSRQPVELVYAEETDDVGAAIEREKQLKRWSRKKKEALIDGDVEMLRRNSWGKRKWWRYFHRGRERIFW